MSYRQLLDPKAFAKDKSKKKVPNYGPQQSRKPKADQPSETQIKMPQFDPKVLLNPKAAASSSATVNQQPPAQNDCDAVFHEDAENTRAGSGMSGLLERMHNVQERETVAQPRKRQAHTIEDSEEDDSAKKAKSTFTGGRGGGVISEGMKEERKKYAEQAKITPIDLTADDEDDVVFVSEKINDNSNQEVCLGRLHAKAHAFRIPSSPGFQLHAANKGMWPLERIVFKRIPAQNNIIDLYSRTSLESNMGTKFGNLDVKVASALCPLLDGNAVNKFRIKMFTDPDVKRPGEQPGMPVSKFIPISIILYSPRKFQQAIGKHLSQKQLFLTTPHKLDPGVEVDNPHTPKILGRQTDSLRKPLNTHTAMVTRTQEEINRDARNMFDSLTKSEDLPEKEGNTEIIRTPLMSHQQQALFFLAEHEADKPASDEKDYSLWKARSKGGRQVWMNIITGHELAQPPPQVRGGILADMMGLGKTLSILALVADTLDEAEAFGKQEAPIDLEGVDRNAKTTLIICPKSVMSNWLTQIRDHTYPGRLRIYSYHGTSRNQNLDELAQYDFVLASYNTAQAEFSNKNSRRTALASINWFRIVLDEGHQIRNSSTAISKACCALSAQRRWAVTGTPVQNRLDDLGALIRFLRIKPFDEDQNWAQYITSPFRVGNENVLQHLRLLVDSITLRRLKDRIDLPDRHEVNTRLDFNDDEKLIYSQFALQANKELRIITGQGNNKLRGKAYAHILKAITRLRLISVHGKEMLGEDDQRELEGLTHATAIDLGDELVDDEPDEAFVSEKNAYENFILMGETERNTCAGCGGKIGDKLLNAPVEDDQDESDSEDLESSSDATEEDVLCYLTPCYYLSCLRCKDAYVNDAVSNLEVDGFHTCMYCENYERFGLFKILRSELKKWLDARNGSSKKERKAKWNEHSYSGPHTKVIALLQELKESAEESARLPPNEPPIRSVVFSGWTQYLDLIEYALDKNDIRSLRLDGKMSVKARSTVLHAFAKDPTVTVLLVSIKAGGQGLNLTAASKVYMMEPQFNPGVEAQAIDRVHRLGQTRPVRITHFIMRESIEEKILKLQEKKKDLARLTMERKMSKSEEAKKRIEELKDLFK